MIGPIVAKLHPQAVAAFEALQTELARIPKPPCADEPDAWFSRDDDDRHLARLICGDCTAAPECLAYALAQDERFGVWGGTDLGRAAAVPTEKDRKPGRRGPARPKESASA